MRALWTTALTLLALAATARAGDRLDVRRVAFSPDGTRALVVTAGGRDGRGVRPATVHALHTRAGRAPLVVAAGVLDGSGFSLATVQALDTRTGRTLLKVAARSETRPVPAVVTALLIRERPRLAPLGLTPGRAARPVYTQTVPVQAPVWAEGTP